MSRFVTEIKGEASMGRTDLNKAAETILIPLLNEIYGWNLVNVNYAEDDNNYPGIDLADKAAKVSIQVTATTSSEKVKHTLRQFVKYEQYLEYDRLIIFFLKERQIYKSKTTQTFQDIVQGKIDFDDDKDIWDWRNLLKEVASFQIDRVNRIREILEDNFGGDRQPKLKQETNWRETCQVLLEQWKGLTTNALTTTPDRVSFQIDDVFVPLGVVERKQKPRHAHSDGSPEQGSELYDEKVTPISQNDFFENVLRQGQSQYSQGRRIAIIGEPGAGKTTHLQKIGDWILKETDDIPIWIPLSAIGTKGLREYLSQVWLQAAIPELEVTEHHRDDLGQLLKTGKVWLLLDGADEMTVSDALHHIATQMREGWLRNIRVVLTCRLNVWEAGKNALDNFDVYRNLDFEYPDEAHQFIDKWFREKPGLQQKLKLALEQPGKERIRDMVKNPLRLTLLCYSWQIRQGELPETKAGLYEWFVDAFYEWNKGKAPYKLTSAKRKELNQALGELAREAIDQNSSRFRLSEKFVTHFLGDVDDKGSLFNLALQLGWLNCIGVAEENPFDKVYAFFHPTFQEYFAALAVMNSSFFLNHIFQKPNKGSYRIFEPRWKEVFLLWLGRNDVSMEDRNSLLEALVEFNDLCHDLYKYRAFCLVALGIAEFTTYVRTNFVLERLIIWNIGYIECSIENKKWSIFTNSYTLENLTRSAIHGTNRNALIDSAVSLVKKNLNSSVCRMYIEFLERFIPDNEKIIQVLIQVIETSENQQNREQAANLISKIGGKNVKVIDALKSRFCVVKDRQEKRIVASALGRLDHGNSEVIEILAEDFLADDDDFASSQNGRLLREIDVNQVAVQKINDRLNFSRQEFERSSLRKKLNLVDPTNPNAYGNLQRDSSSKMSDRDKLENALAILKVNPEDSDSVSKLITLLQETEDIGIKKQIIASFGLAVNNSLAAVDALIELLYPEQDQDILILSSEMLKHVGCGNRRAIFALSQLIKANQDRGIRYHYAECLGEIDLDKNTSVNVFFEVFYTKDVDNQTKIYAIDRISEICRSTPTLHSKAIQIFSDVLNIEESPEVCLETVWNLWLYSACDPEVVYSLLLNQLLSSKDVNICSSAAWRLRRLFRRGDSCSRSLVYDAISKLSKALPSTAYPDTYIVHGIYYSLALFFMQMVSYLEFYQSWHSSPSEISEGFDCYERKMANE